MNFNGALEEKLPWPDEGVNKYSRGKLTVVAGSARYSGAAVLAALASQRMGAGYTEVITDPSAVNVVRLSSPSLVVRPSDDWKPGELKASEPGKPCAVCIGPGFTGDDDAAADLVARVLKKAPCPVLVDGGGLARLATKKNLHTLAARFTDGLTTVITPHGGEAARLAASLGLPTSNPEKLAAGLSLATQAIVVLKGPDTFVSDPCTCEGRYRRRARGHDRLVVGAGHGSAWCGSARHEAARACRQGSSRSVHRHIGRSRGCHHCNSPGHPNLQ